MTSYFRCEDPSRQCPHSNTHEVQILREGACPNGNPDCERYRRKVPLWTALLELHPKLIWTSIAFTLLIIISILSAVIFGSSEWQRQYENLETELLTLDKRLDVLANQSIPVSTVANSSASLQRLMSQTQELQRVVEEAKSTNSGPEEVQRLKTQWQTLNELSSNYNKPNVTDLDAISRQTVARQLANDYESLAEQVEMLRPVFPSGDITAEQAYDNLTSNILDGISRSRMLGKSSDQLQPNQDELALIQKIKDSLIITQNDLERLSSVTQLPFTVESAGLVVAASPMLAESLILPLLQDRFDGKVTAQGSPPAWFFVSDDPSIMPGAVLTITSQDPYENIIDGKADLVISNQSAQAATIKRFAETFGGANLQSRAFSEIIALDAIALLAHPEAPVKTVNPVQLSEGRWLVRANDAEIIQRILPRKVHIQEVEDPFNALLNDPKARVISLYHQCSSNLAAKYLPYQPADDAPALATSPFSIATEDYGLTYRITAAHAPNAPPGARKFIDFLTSELGQEKIASAGYVDLRLTHQQEDVDPSILATLAKAVGREKITSANRYSTNLRFGINEHELDIKAQADIGRLPRSLAKDFPNGTVVALGFTDSTGTPAGNHTLSIKRAQHIVSLLHQFKISATAAGLGQQFPIDSNSNDQGRARNRRVEVWVVKN